MIHYVEMTDTKEMHRRTVHVKIEKMNKGT